MKLKLFVLLIILLISSPGMFGGKTATLKGLNKPSMIDIHQDRLFVLDMEKIRVYSLKDYSLIKSFGKKGSGPGEYNITTMIPLRILASRDFLQVEAVNKVLFYTHDGIFHSEIKKAPFINLIQKAGNYFIGRRMIITENATLSTSSVSVYDQSMKKVKELFRQPSVQQGGFPHLRLRMGQDFLLFKVYHDLIFVDESFKGPIIEVFDAGGKSLYKIRLPYEKIPVSSDYKAKTIADLGRDPHVLSQLIQFKMQWKEFSKFFKYEFPDFFPAIQTLDISNEKLYVRTFKVKEGKDEFIIMDLKGKVLKRLFVKPTVKRWLMSTMMGVNLEIIHNDKIYYILENDKEEWELHIQPVKI